MNIGMSARPVRFGMLGPIMSPKTGEALRALEAQLKQNGVQTGIEGDVSLGANGNFVEVHMESEQAKVDVEKALIDLGATPGEPVTEGLNFWSERTYPTWDYKNGARFKLVEILPPGDAPFPYK